MRKTTLCYIERDGCYLMLHRVKKQNDANHDKWIGVGGGFEPGEDAQACLLREVREETSLTLTLFRKRGVIAFHSDEWEDEEMHLFTADQWTGELIECSEGKLEWVEKERLLELPHWEGDRIFLELLRRDAPFFHLTLEYRGEALARAELDGRELTL